MAGSLQEAEKLFGTFKSSYDKGELDVCHDILGKLKLKLTEFPALPPLYQSSATALEELKLAREILEYAVGLSVKREDESAFERNFLQLKAYYTDTRDRLPSSPLEAPVLGLNLLRLLVQNRIAEFHTELELLLPEVQDNPCIRHVIELEQALMEGAYNRILNARQQVPDPLYLYFTDLLMHTVRDEIAACSEKAYEFLTVTDAKKLLTISGDQEMREYAEKHGWEVRNNCVYFRQEKEKVPRSEIPSMQLIQQTLGYARELERIV